MNVEQRTSLCYNLVPLVKILYLFLKLLPSPILTKILYYSKQLYRSHNSNKSKRKEFQWFC